MPHCRTDVQGLTWEEGPAAPLPGGCLAYRPATGRRVPAARLPGGDLPPGPKMRLKTNFIYIQVPTFPQPDSRGTKL